VEKMAVTKIKKEHFPYFEVDFIFFVFKKIVLTLEQRASLFYAQYNKNNVSLWDKDWESSLDKRFEFPSSRFLSCDVNSLCVQRDPRGRRSLR
jgi:hypothetical protein